MNIKFADKLSSHVWANMFDKPEHQKPMLNFLARFFGGGYCNCLETDLHLEATPDGEMRPATNEQNGTVQVLHIAVDLHSRGYDENFGAFTSEFNWAVFSLPVDRYGEPTQRESITNRLIVGGFVNHGTLTAPDWSSHT